MAKNFTKNNKKEAGLFSKSKNVREAPLSLDQSLHEVQSTDIEKTSF
ncbi:MAG: hypothetical protein AAGU27_02130 [Dehalobacterium sp.]